MIQLTDNMELNMKEDQSVVASVFLRRGHKIIIGGRKLEGLGRKKGGKEKNRGTTSGVKGDRGVV